MADYYQLLGVDRRASPDELKRAYRQRARELHPDANPGDPDAEERFKAVTRAYEILSDPDLRARYDRFGEDGVSGLRGTAAGNDLFGAGLGDLFETFFGANPFGGGGGGAPAGPPRGQDLEVVADLTFEQALFGTTAPVTVRTAFACEACGGRGAAEGTRPVTCADCGGSGQVRRVRQSFLGQMVTASVCPRCSGLGEVVVTPCPMCSGEGRIIGERTFQVDVPAGVDTGSTLRLAGRGAVGPRGGPPGDLYVHLRVATDERFRRDGPHLFTRLPISIAQAALGTTVTLPMPDGTDERISCPPGTQSGRVVVLRGRGVPTVQGRGKGDLHVEIVVETPTGLSVEEEELLRRLAEVRGEEVEPPTKGFLSRLKSAFR